MNPPDMLRLLDRLIGRAQTDAEANTLYQARRQIAQGLIGRAGTVYADEPRHASGRAGNDHATRLNDIENGSYTPQQKAQMRRQVFEHALRNP